jgi:hypothetical protein
MAGVVKEVVALFLLAAAEDERTDEEETALLAGATGSAIAAALLRGVRCELIRAAFDFSAAAAGAAIPAPAAAPRRPELPPSLSFSASGPFCPAVSAAGVVREEADAEVVERPLGSDGTPACESHSICMRKTRVCSEAM